MNQYVVVIDEVDQLTDKSLLYDLYRIQQLTMVLIANREEELFKDLNGRLNSRLSGCERIQFSSYTHEQLVSILDDCVEWGIQPDVIDRDQLSTIADAASGDARQAIETLRQAAKTAHQNQLDKITDSVIEDAILEATSEIRQKSLSKLTQDQRVIYEIIEASDPISSKALYKEYTEQIDDPVSKRMMRNYLDKMKHYNLITGMGATRSRTYSLQS